MGNYYSSYYNSKSNFTKILEYKLLNPDYSYYNHSYYDQDQELWIQGFEFLKEISFYKSNIRPDSQLDDFVGETYYEKFNNLFKLYFKTQDQINIFLNNQTYNYDINVENINLALELDRYEILTNLVEKSTTLTIKEVDTSYIRSVKSYRLFKFYKSNLENLEIILTNILTYNNYGFIDDLYILYCCTFSKFDQLLTELDYLKIQIGDEENHVENNLITKITSNFKNEKIEKEIIKLITISTIYFEKTKLLTYLVENYDIKVDNINCNHVVTKQIYDILELEYNVNFNRMIVKAVSNSDLRQFIKLHQLFKSKEMRYHQEYLENNYIYINFKDQILDLDQLEYLVQNFKKSKLIDKITNKYRHFGDCKALELLK